MDQKKTLWIIACTGFFLLVVLGTAKALFSPDKVNQTIAHKKAKQDDGWISLSPKTDSELPRRPSVIEVTPPKDYDPDFIEESLENVPKVSDLTVYADNATVITNNPIENTSNVTPKSEVAKNQVQRTESQVRPKPVEPKVVPPVKTVPKLNGKYWIQVTALKSRKGADLARETLGRNKIEADVFTFTNSQGELYYRVRVGPFETKTEADRLKDMISKIPSYERCYVTDK